MENRDKIKDTMKLFDTNDLSDIDNKIRIGKGKQDIFGQQLFELFLQAKKAGIEKLNVNQVMVAYYRL